MSVLLKIDNKLYNDTFFYWLERGIDISKFIVNNKKVKSLDKTKANREVLDKSIKNIEEGEELYEMKLVDGVFVEVEKYENNI